MVDWWDTLAAAPAEATSTVSGAARDCWSPAEMLNIRVENQDSYQGPVTGIELAS